MIQWSDKVPDGFFTLEDVTVGSTKYLYVHTGDYDYSVNPKQNWRGHCYSQSDKNTVWKQLKKNSNGDILTGDECSSSPANVAKQYVWFEYQPLQSAGSYTCGTIAKKSIIPANYNDNAEFIFEYNGKTAKVINSRKFKIISSLEVLDNGDIVFKLHHTGSTVYTIVNNADGTFTFKDEYIPADSRDYSDLTSSLIFYLPTEYGTAVLNIPNNTSKAPTKTKEFCVSNMETDPSIAGSFNYALKNAGPGDVIKFCFDGEEDLVFTAKHVSEILTHPLVATIDGSTYKGKVEIDKLNSTGVGDQCFFLGDGGNVNNVTFSNTVIQAKDKNTSVYFGNIEHCIFKNTIFFNVDYDLHIKNVEHCTFDGEYGPNPQIYAEVELINDCSFSNAEIGAYLCTGNPIIRGCVFSDLEYGIVLGMGKERTGVVEIDNCEIKGVEKAIYVYGTDKLYLHHSNVSNSTYCILEKVDDLHVEFCNISVDNVITTEGGIVEKSFISPIHLNATNNTVFVNNTISTETIQEDLSLFNNTIIVNPSSNIEDFSPNKAVGNIFICNGITSLQGESNVVLNNSDEPGTFNILDAASLLDGSFDKANDVFIPNYSINENKVSYVQLKAEKVNGTSIRFDRLTDVVTDINGVTRETNTCAGAVELKLINFSVRQFECKEVNDVVCPESPFGSVVYYYGTRWERPYSFIIELTDRKGNKFQSEPVLTNEYSKSIIVDKLPAGNYTMFVYYIDDKGEKLGMADFYGELSVSSTFDDHVKDKTNITIKELERSVPLATMGSRNYTVTNKCTEPNGGIDCSVYKWTDDVFTVQIYSVDEDENETLVLDDVQPDRIDEYNDVKTAIFMIHKLAGGTYKFKVSDACGVVIDYNFTVRDEIQPDPVLTYEVTPYSCKKSDSKEDAKDGSITINVENYGYNSTLSKVVGEDSEILSYTTRESDGSVIFNLTELGTSDNFTLKLQNTCFTEDKEFEINMKEEAQKNGLFYLKSAEVKANAECTADNRRINFVVKGGQPSYSYQVIDKNTGNVAYTLDAYSASNTTSILPEGEYKFVASDANGCTDEISEGLDITTKHTLTAKKQAVCGDYIHVDLDYTGSLLSAGVHLTSYKSNSTTKKVTFDENSGDKYFFYEGDCDWMTGTFSSDYCQGFALLEEEEEKPLNIGYGRLPEIVPVSCLNSEGGSYTYYPRSQMSLRGYKLVLVATNKTSGKSYKSNEANNAGTALSVNELPAGEYEAYLALTYEDCIVESSKMTLDDFTIEDASTTSIKVEEIKCSGKVFSTVHFGNVESVLLYDAEDNVTAPSIIRGIISSTEEGSFERAYLTLINGCEQNATLEKTDETDNLIATFKELTVKYREKTEQSACDETTINDGSLTITLESSLDDPAYAYSIILKDAKGKVAGQIDDITDFSQSFEFRELAPGTYNGFLAVKVGDCLLESENKFFTEEISLNKETVAVERLAYSKPVEDVCKGTATLPFTVTGAIEGATVKVMKGEEEIESIAIAEDGDYSTSSLEVGKYTLVYVATNANGCIEKDEKTTSYTKSQFVLPIKNTQLTAHNATCKEGGDITGEIHFASWSTLPYPFVVVVVDEGGKELKSQAFTVDVAANSEANRVVKIEDLPVGDYTLKTYFVADECQIEPSNATSLWQQLATTKLDGNSDYRTNNTFSIYSPDPIDFTYTAEDVTCAEDGASVTFKVENANGTPTVTLYDADKKAVSTGMTIVGLKPSVTYSAKVEDENGCTAEIEEVKVTYKEQPSLEGIKGEAKPYNSTCVNKGNGGMVVSYKGNTDKKDLILIVTDTKGGRQTVAISEEEGDVEFKDLAIGAYTIYVDYNNGECATSSPAAEELDKTTIEAASAAAIAVEELHCGDKVYSNIQFGADMESVLLYDKDENATSVPLSRGVTSALVEGSFERAYLTYLNGCEQNATLEKTDETDNLVATFKQVTLTDLKKTEQSACDETTINDGSLTITLESTLENPAYSYSIILTDDKGKEINQIDDITDFTQPFVFNALAPGTYKGHLAVKVGDCLLEDEATLFSEEINLNKETVAVERLAYGKPVEDVCKGTATLPFTVKGAIEGATVKVMKGEEEIESIAIAEDGDYSTSALEVGKYTLVYTATNANGCIEKDEKTTSYTKTTFNLPLRNAEFAAKNPTCTDKNNGALSGRFGFASMATLPYPFYVLAIDENEKEYKSVVYPQDMPTNSEVSRDFLIDNLPVGDYKVKALYVTENCDVEIPMTWTIASKTLAGSNDYRTNNTFSIYNPKPLTATYTAEDVICADKGASVTFKVENATGTPALTLYNAEGKAVSSGMTIVDLKPGVTYSAKVEDENGCAAEIEEVKVIYKEQPSLAGVTAEIVAYDETCFEGNNGRLVVNFSGVTSADGLKFTAVDEQKEAHVGIINAAGTSARFSELAPGKYTVYVDYDNDGCSTSSPAAIELGSKTINAIGKLEVDASSLVPTIATCATPANGRVDIDILNYVNGGKITVYQNGSPMWGTIDASVGEYTNGAPCQFYYENEEKKEAHVAHLKIPNVNGGKFTVEVENGCETDKTEYTFDVDELSKPTIQYREEDSNVALNCSGDKDGVLAFYVGGGNANNLVAYVNEEEVTPDKAGKCVKESLMAGTYTLAYKSKIEGCKDEASVEQKITEAIVLKATYTAENVECADKGASVTFKIEGGTGIPSVTLYNAEGKAVSSGVTIVGLKPDQVYSAKVEDANGCTYEIDEIKVTYAEKPSLQDVQAEIVGFDETCFEGNNGRLVVKFSGVTETEGLLFTAIDEQNERHKGTINTAGTSARIEGLAPGRYTVYVDYDNGECSTSTPSAKELGTANILAIGKLAVDASSLNTQMATCTNPANGRIDIDILNWTNLSTITVYRNGSPIWGTTEASLGEYSNSAPCQFYYEDKEKQDAHVAHLKIENLNVGGTYKVEVENDCESGKDDYSFEFGALKKPSIQLAETDSRLLLDCDYSKDGVLAFSVEGGNASTFGVFVSKQNESGEFTDEIEVAADENGNYVATNLLANNYMATFKSKEEGCKDEASLKEAVEITAPEAVSMHLSYGKVECEATGAKATVEAGGGTPGYTYSWTNSEGTLLGEKEEITGLSEGKDYQVVVKDSKKCLVSQKFNIDPLVKTPLTSIKVSNWDHKDQTCYNINNGSISFSFSGNSAASSLQFAVFGEDGQPVAGKSITSNAEKDDVTIDELAPGIYDVKLAYSYKGCEADDKSISVVEAINIEGLEKPMFIDKNYTITPNKCENASEGRMHFEMMGWKDGIYTWTLQRAGQSKDDLTENTHHGELLENGAIAFDLWGLPEGENIFTMWDGCENGFRYSKSDVVKDAYEDKPELEVVDKIAFSCLDRKDGSFTFVASPWDVANTAKFKKDEEEAKDVHPSLKDGKAYFEYKEQGAGTYTLSVKDLCKRDVILPFDFTEFSSKNGALVAAVDFDADAAKCDVDARQFTVTANGGTAPYVYAITKVDGTEVKTSEAIESTTFESDLLTDGSYKVSVTDKTDCKAIYNGDIIIDPAHVMEAKMREAVCGDKKTVLIVASIDKGTIAGNKFVAYDAEGKSYPAGMALGSMSFYSIPVDVKLKGLSAVVGAECSVYAETVELPLDASALETANVTVASHHNQQCYKVDNGEITLNYEGPEMSYDVMMFLKYTVDGEVKYIESDPQHGTKLQFAFEKLAPGEYELYLTHVVGKCDAGVEPRKIQDVTIKELKEPLELFKEKTRVIQSTCYSEMNAQAIIAVTGWVPDTYKETFYKYKEDGSLEYLWSGMNANDISDEEHKVHAWATQKNLTAGKYHTTWGDICTPEKVVYDFTVEPLNKPKLEILSSSYTDLKCSYDKAYIDFRYEGGAPDNKRLLFKFQPKGKGYDDWNWTTEELKSENTYRYYGHAMGDGNQGHDKAEGTTYELTDEDKGLADGSYVIIYQDSTGACPKDEVSGSIVVKRPDVQFHVATQDVVCASTNQGTVNILPVRYNENIWRHWTDEIEGCPAELRDKGRNWGELILKTPQEQQAAFAQRENFYSNLFSDIASFELKAENHTQAEIKQIISDSIFGNKDKNIKGRGNEKYPLDAFYKDGGYNYAMTDWIGFNMLPMDKYTFVFNDVYGCTYEQEFEIIGPEDALKITEAVYAEDAIDPVCNAAERRIKFTSTGGHYPYYYSVRDVNSKQSFDDARGSISSSDYIPGYEIVKGWTSKDKMYIDFTSGMLSAGTYEVSVIDSLGCQVKWPQHFTVKSKFEIDAKTHVDLCDPSSANMLEIKNANADNYSYSLYIGHATHCQCYPYCSVDDINSCRTPVGPLTIKHVHHHDPNWTDDDGNKCPVMADDCMEIRPSEFRKFSYSEKDERSGAWKRYDAQGLNDLPSGTIGVMMTDANNCTAYAEYTYSSKGLPTSFYPLAVDSVKCNADNNRGLASVSIDHPNAAIARDPEDRGAVEFKLFGGHDYYQSIKLDDVDVSGAITMIDKDTSLSPVNRKEEHNVILIGNKSLFDKLKAPFDKEAAREKAKKEYYGKDVVDSVIVARANQIMREASKHVYSFKINGIDASLNWMDESKNHQHKLVVTDAVGCESTFEFDVYQPERLTVDAATSVICADKSARIFPTDKTTGGVSPYLWSVKDLTSQDYIATPDAEIYPKDYNGDPLETLGAFLSEYADNYQKNDHIPVLAKVDHYLWVSDANGCEAMADVPVAAFDDPGWGDIEQDQFISTWHNYGDILVVTDQTSYATLEAKGYHYDSMKVVVVLNDNGVAQYIEGKSQPKENYAYGIRDCNMLDNVAENSTCGEKYVEFLKKTYQGPSWGIPIEAIKDYGNYVASLGDSKEPETLYDKFDLLVDKEALKRMNFVQFKEVYGKTIAQLLQEKKKKGMKDGAPYQEDFKLLTIAYVGGCDVITEHNGLLVNIQGDDPFPEGKNYKDMIKVIASPNPVKPGQTCTIEVSQTSNESFHYTIFGLEGRYLGSGTIAADPDKKPVKKYNGKLFDENNSPVDLTDDVQTEMDKNHGEYLYVYQFDFMIPENASSGAIIVKVNAETNSSAATIIVEP